MMAQTATDSQSALHFLKKHEIGTVDAMTLTTQRLVEHVRRDRRPTNEELQQNGIPYQNLINLYLRECAESEKKLSMKWG